MDCDPRHRVNRRCRSRVHRQRPYVPVSCARDVRRWGLTLRMRRVVSRRVAERVAMPFWLFMALFMLGVIAITMLWAALDLAATRHGADRQAKRLFPDDDTGQ